MEQDPTSSPVGTTPPLLASTEGSLPSVVNINQMTIPDFSFDSGARSSPVIPSRSARHASSYHISPQTSNSDNVSGTFLNTIQRAQTPPAAASSPTSAAQSPVSSFSNQQFPTASSSNSTANVSFSSNSSPLRQPSVDATSSSPVGRSSEVITQSSGSPDKSTAIFNTSTPVLLSSSHNRCISQRTVQPLDHSISTPTPNSSKTTVYGEQLSLQKSTSSEKNKSTSQSHSSKRTEQTNPFDTQDIQTQLSLSLNDYLYYRGFLRGEGSDVTVRCFNRSYKLHKFILSRSPYFSSLFSSFWESSSEQSSPEKKPVYTLNFGRDENITERAFELAISRLYGHEDIEEERKNIFGLFAVANFLDLPSLVDTCVTNIISRISYNTVASILYFFHKRHYGEDSKTVVEACKNFLLAEGYEMSFDLWMTIPNKVIAEVVGSDAFFVPTEWERCQFLIQIINLRIVNAKSPSTQGLGFAKGSFNLDLDDFDSLRSTLDHDIRYCHMTYDQLETLEHIRDVNKQFMISRKVLREALWLQVGLKKKIMRVSEDCTELGIVREVPAGKLYGYDDEEEGAHSDENDDIKNNEVDTPSLGSSPTAKVKKFDNESPKRISTTSDTAESKPSLSDEEEEETYYSIPNADETLDAPWDRVKNHINQPTKITKFPPFRFAVKFNDATLLENDRRVYSHTYWYAGNFWNVYLQKVAFKNKHQLGVYIHRSPPDSFIDPLLRESANAASATSFVNPLKYGTSNAGLGNSFVSSDFRRRSMGANPGVSSVIRRDIDSSVDLRASAGAGTEVHQNPISSETVENAISAAATAPNNLFNLLSPSFANNSNVSNNNTGATSPSSSVLTGAPLETSHNETTADISNHTTNIYGDVALAALERGGDDSQIIDHLLVNLSLSNVNADNEVGAELARKARNSIASLSLANPLLGNHLGTLYQHVMTNPTPSNFNASTDFPAKPGFVLSKQAQIPEYIDKRKKVSAFFEIYTPSRKGHSSLTCFSSTPDMFNISQSWGWKSASLYLKAEELKKGGNNDGLKFMVSIGLV